MHLAASEGHLEVVRLLMDEHGAPNSPCDRWGGTPLDDAIRHGHEEVVGFLLSNGAKMGSSAAAPTDLCSAAFAGDATSFKVCLLPTTIYSS